MKYTNRLLCGLGAAFYFFCGSTTAAVVGSKHDMTSATGTAAQVTAVTDEVCVFCHTPHGSDATVTAAPLWNKSLPVGPFNEYTSSTMDGTADLTSSVSLACLSCHDGTQAMDTVLNAPSTAASYNYNAGGAEIDSGAVGVMTGTPVPVIGTDLRNDHPVSVEYAGGGLTWAVVDATNNVANNANDKAFNDPFYTATGSGKMAVAGVGGNLPLYNKSGVPFVECASCHDPHSSNLSFLRISNAASAVCTACHVK